MNAWIDVNIRLPEKYKDVLIKMGDGSQRVGRLNRLNAWEMASYQHCKHQYMANPVVWFDENVNQPFFVCDVANLIGSTVGEVSDALVHLGHPPRSTNMTITPEEALAVKKYMTDMDLLGRYLTVTTVDGEALLVSWQDEEHRILDVVWEKPKTAKQTQKPWGWVIVDKNGNAQAIRPRKAEFFGVVQERETFTREDLVKMDREWAGLAPHAVVTLFADDSSVSCETNKGQS